MRRCDFADVVLSGFIVSIMDRRVQDRVEERMIGQGYRMEERGEVLRYLGRKRIWGCLEGSELLREFYLTVREGESEEID